MKNTINEIVDYINQMNSRRNMVLIIIMLVMAGGILCIIGRPEIKTRVLQDPENEGETLYPEMEIISEYSDIKQDSEFRGLWVVRTSMQSQESIEQIISRAVEGNFNAILVQINGRGEAYYESDIVPKMPNISKGFDPLAFCIQKAHYNDLQVHAWINAFTVGVLGTKDYQEDHVLTKHPEWSLVDSDLISTFDYTPGMGRNELVSVMLDPAIEGVKNYIRDVATEVVSNYDVDGIHFDYIRYPGRNYGYGQIARDKFLGLTGYDPVELLNKTESINSGAIDEEDYIRDIGDKWDEFRQDQVTEILRRSYFNIKNIKPDVLVSCAVFPNANDSRNLKMQNWQSWIEEGIVDFVVPMAYTPDTQVFKEHMEKVIKVSSSTPVFAGIGAYLMLEDPKDCIEKINTARELGVSGIVLFSYDAIRAKDDYWKAFINGPFSEYVRGPRYNYSVDDIGAGY